MLAVPSVTFTVFLALSAGGGFVGSLMTAKEAPSVLRVKAMEPRLSAASPFLTLAVMVTAVFPSALPLSDSGVMEKSVGGVEQARTSAIAQVQSALRYMI
ncbi:MAG: hypothetical protein QM765_05815 [Myxococcales bacterium]